MPAARDLVAHHAQLRARESGEVRAVSARDATARRRSVVLGQPDEATTARAGAKSASRGALRADPPHGTDACVATNWGRRIDDQLEIADRAGPVAHGGEDVVDMATQTGSGIEPHARAADRDRRALRLGVLAAQLAPARACRPAIGR